MNAALELLSLPAAGPQVLGVEWRRRAGLAADARVAAVVEGQERDGVRLRVGPHVLVRPGGQRADLAEDFPRWQAEVFDRLQVGARRRLLAPEAGEPDVVRLERSKQRPTILRRISPPPEEEPEDE